MDDRYLLRLDLPRGIEVTVNGERVGVLTGITMSVPPPEAEVVVVRRLLAPDADGTRRLGDFPMTLATRRMTELPPLIEMGDEADGEGNLSDLIIEMRGE